MTKKKKVVIVVEVEVGAQVWAVQGHDLHLVHGLLLQEDMQQEVVLRGLDRDREIEIIDNGIDLGRHPFLFLEIVRILAAERVLDHVRDQEVKTEVSTVARILAQNADLLRYRLCMKHFWSACWCLEKQKYICITLMKLSLSFVGPCALDGLLPVYMLGDNILLYHFRLFARVLD